LEETERQARTGIKKKLGEQFQRARAEVQATVDALKREQKLMKAKETKQRLAELEQATRAQLAPVQTVVPLDQLAAGAFVEIAGLGVTGILLEPPQGKKRVRVKVGEGEVIATVANLVGLSHGAEEPGAAPSAPPARVRSTGISAEEQTGVDVRGQAADEALDQIVAALDRAALSGAPLLRIIHGHGTGRLKQVVREYLRDSPYVEEFRPGDRAEGGDGVTIVRLR
jgi:DNA mismatch repair protein MutS2